MKVRMSDLHWGVVTSDEFGYMHAAFTTRFDAEKWKDAQMFGWYRVVRL